jgi:hypothetical protein
MEVYRLKRQSDSEGQTAPNEVKFHSIVTHAMRFAPRPDLFCASPTDHEG